MALPGALCATLPAATGITSKSLRALMTGLLAAPAPRPDDLRPAAAPPDRMKT